LHAQDIDPEEANRRLAARVAAHAAAATQQSAVELEKLRQRVKELELENADLRSQVAGTKQLQAEVAELRKKLQEGATAANPPVAKATTNPSPPVAMTNDIAGFKEFAGRFTKNLKAVWDDEKKKDGMKPDPEYTYQEDFSLTSVDMLKSDSLVHPVVAVADIQWISGYERRDKSFFSATFFRLKLSFAWTNGRWEYVDGRRIVDQVFGNARESYKVGEEKRWDNRPGALWVVATERTNASAK